MCRHGHHSGLKRINADIALDAHDIGRVAKIFYLPEETTSGDVSLNLTIKDLELPVTKLPYMVGNVKIKNGFLHVPGLTKPFRHVDLSADFKGTSFDVEMNGLTCGQSVLRKGVLKVNGLETPRFSLSIDMERFNLVDFTGAGKKPFRFHSYHRRAFSAVRAEKCPLRHRMLPWVIFPARTWRLMGVWPTGRSLFPS